MVGLTQGLEGSVGCKLVTYSLDASDLPSIALTTHRAYISQINQLAFFERVARAACVENLALIGAQHADISTYGVFGDYVTSAPTFREALGIAKEMMCFHSSFDRLSIRNVGGHLILTYHSALRNTEGYQHYATLAIAVLLSIAKPYFGNAHRKRIEFNFPSPASASQYEDMFLCEVAFDRPELCILFAEDSGPVRRMVKPTRLITAGEVARDAFGQAPQDLVGAVRSLIRSQIDSGPTLSNLAKQLDYSERTLRRRLDEQGLSFRNIITDVRMACANELLTQTDLDIGEISSRIGYSEPAHFSRAYRKVTGLTPVQVRHVRAA